MNRIALILNSLAVHLLAPHRAQPFANKERTAGNLTPTLHLAATQTTGDTEQP